ncbi:MAG TPA: hypothetical protein VGX28_09000 [Frankiaceae bacterium]|jgi:hypothetical protein|nr:hypothetical protein [Frankiaceae bacterium]
MPRRALLLAAFLAAVTALPSSAAAPKPQVTDPKGDALGAQPGADLASVTFATTGTGSGRAYVAKKLVVTMAMAGDVITTPGLTYEISTETSSCGRVTLSAQQGSPYSQVTHLNGWADWGDCMSRADATSNVELLTAAVKGNTITWSFSLKMLPKELAVRTSFTTFEARIDPTNPVIPFPSSATQTENGLVDVATSDVVWKMR